MYDIIMLQNKRKDVIMKLKKFLSILLLGGMVASSVPATRALTPEQREEIKLITTGCLDNSNYTLNKELLELLCGFVCNVDMKIEEDITASKQILAFLNRIALSKGKEFRAPIDTVAHICSAYELFNREFSKEEYKLVTDKLKYIARENNTEFSSDLGKCLITRCRFLVEVLNQHAISKGLVVSDTSKKIDGPSDGLKFFRV